MYFIYFIIFIDLFRMNSNRRENEEEAAGSEEELVRSSPGTSVESFTGADDGDLNR